MKANKKAQALSMNTIIIAALALLVLAILSLLFISRMNTARSDLNDCEKNGGRCVTLESGMRTCQDVLTKGNYQGISGQYTVGRQMSSQKCYNPITGQVETDQICCSFA